jgi:hypothetical protein
MWLNGEETTTEDFTTVTGGPDPYPGYVHQLEYKNPQWVPPIQTET